MKGTQKSNSFTSIGTIYIYNRECCNSLIFYVQNYDQIFIIRKKYSLYFFCIIYKSLTACRQLKMRLNKNNFLFFSHQLQIQMYDYVRVKNSWKSTFKGQTKDETRKAYYYFTQKTTRLIFTSCSTTTWFYVLQII